MAKTQPNGAAIIEAARDLIAVMEALAEETDRRRWRRALLVGQKNGIAARLNAALRAYDEANHE